MKRIAILGSTGSIGISTLSVSEKLKDEIEVRALAAGSNIGLLSRQAEKFNVSKVCIGNEELAIAARKMLPKTTALFTGAEGMSKLVSSNDIDIVVFAVGGSDKIEVLAKAIVSGKTVALANKESLVSAGTILNALARESGSRIIPVDSEHSAIFQCLDGKTTQPSKLYLTGSGGPLLNIPKKKFDTLSPQVILKHPKWKMGKKISVDSATMMNKGLEIIEAMHLFGMAERDINVLIHPEAIIHSMVEFSDGAVLAQMAVPDMRLPIEYALTYPERKSCIVKRLDFSALGELTFTRPDYEKFPCLALARKAAIRSGVYPAILCATDEEVVNHYLAGGIKFTDIPKIINEVMNKYKETRRRRKIAISDILRAQNWARCETRALCCH